MDDKKHFISIEQDLFSGFSFAWSSNVLQMYFPCFISFDVSSFVRKGFSKLSITGKNIIAWYNPKITVRKNTLKKVINACDFESHRRTTARNVVTPPFVTAGPILCTAFWARSNLEPEKIREILYWTYRRKTNFLIVQS